MTTQVRAVVATRQE